MAIINLGTGVAGLADREVDDGALNAGGAAARVDADAERDYEAHRGPLLEMLRSSFPRLRDHEELYQSAWAALLEMEAGGERVRDRGALLRTIAWRRAADLAARRHAVAVDPASAVFSVIADTEPLPDEQVEARLSDDALRCVVESLSEQQAAALKLRYEQDRSWAEVQERLGIGEKYLQKLVRAAYEAIASQLAVEAGGQTRWARRQRSLLLACELGIASRRQRRRAEAMLARDPACRALLRAMRDVAAALPAPVLYEQDDRLRRVVAAPSWLDQAFATTRHAIERLTGRGLPESGALEQAGVGGAGIGAGAAAFKVAVACLAVGGAASLCATGGVFGGAAAAPKVPRAQHVAARSQAVVEPARDHVAVVRRPKRVVRKARSEVKDKHKAVTPVSSSKSRPMASPAPQGSTEFGPGDIGSRSAPQQPAPAPEDGGGEFTP